jgi:hypothetical protein
MGMPAISGRMQAAGIFTFSVTSVGVRRCMVLHRGTLTDRTASGLLTSSGARALARQGGQGREVVDGQGDIFLECAGTAD